MKAYSSREIIRILRNHGWEYHSSVGGHHHYRHRSLPGKVTVPHPKKDFPEATVRSIFRQVGIDV